jgi:nucleoside-diphosphate-sugar epimerase
MRILLTGGSSFTGCWFARELAAAGHAVTATLRRSAYEAVRGERVAVVRKTCETVEGLAFGDDRFVELVAAGGFDLLCVHGAQVDGYRDPGFDVGAALTANTRRAGEIVPRVPRVLVTGSLFEPGAGSSEDGRLPAFSPYGLSKAFTSEVFRYLCGRHGVTFGRFVVPNPFGPMEEARFTASLVRAWRAGETPQVRTPEYVRDNIHVSLLARAYVRFAESLAADGGTAETGPSGYRETQGAFARRFAREIGARLDLATPLELLPQTEWSEPADRVNTDPVDGAALGWEESAAWDDLAGWYAGRPAGE